MTDSCCISIILQLYKLQIKYMRHESVVIAADQDCSLHQSVVVKILLTMFVRVCLSKAMMFLESDNEIQYYHIISII